MRTYVKSQITAGLKALNEHGEGSAVIATLGVVDKDNDITVPGAFGTGQDAKVVPAHDWMHIPLGKATIRESGDEAIADFKLNLDIPAAKDWYHALKFDLEQGNPIQEWSYGFTILDSGQGEEGGQRVRILKSMRVHEISPVMIGAGVNTRTLAMKGKHGGTLEEQLQETIEFAKQAIERCQEVKGLRVADGRDISAERVEQLKEMVPQLEHLLKEVSGLSAISAARGGPSPEEQIMAEQILRESRRLL